MAHAGRIDLTEEQAKRLEEDAVPWRAPRGLKIGWRLVNSGTPAIKGAGQTI
jgi:hypothetical protein